jgi:hypothetical protein
LHPSHLTSLRFEAVLSGPLLVIPSQFHEDLTHEPAARHYDMICHHHCRDILRIHNRFSSFKRGIAWWHSLGELFPQLDLVM